MPANNTLVLDWSGLTPERVGLPFGEVAVALEGLRPCVGALHAEIQAERDLARSSHPPVRSADEPLDYRFMDVPAELLANVGGELDEIRRLASELAARADAFVVLGIGGSYQGAQAIFDALLPAYYNELPREARRGPRIYFEGNNTDGATLHDLRTRLDLDFRRHGATPAGLFALDAISKSGKTLETELAFAILREQMREQDPTGYRERLVFTTGSRGPLAAAAREENAPVLPVPDGVGGRYSVLTAVGLLPAAVMGLEIERLLAGAHDFQAFCDATPDPLENPAWLYATLHALAYRRGATIRVLAVWTQRLEALGRWYDQLLAESLGKGGRGATPLTIVCTRELHSRQQQHQQGTRDKIVTNLLVRQPPRDVAVPPLSFDPDRAPDVAGRTVNDLAHMAVEATNAALNEDGRPTLDLWLPALDEYHLGQLLQMLMNATVMEGKLLRIWPFGQPGVEGYKRQWDARLKAARAGG